MRDSEKNTVKHGGNIVMGQKQKLSLDKKVEIIRDYLIGKTSKSEAARRGGVARDTIDQWVRNYVADGVDAFLPR